MKKEQYTIPGKKTPTVQNLDDFIKGSEARVPVTIHIPERLRFALKREAVERKLKLWELVSEIFEAHFANHK